MIVAYSIAGGIRASIWTDAVQSLSMLVALSILCVVAFYHEGGLGPAFASMMPLDDGRYMNLWPESGELVGTGAMAIGFRSGQSAQRDR